KRWPRPRGDEVRLCLVDKPGAGKKLPTLHRWSPSGRSVRALLLLHTPKIPMAPAPVALASKPFPLRLRTISAVFVFVPDRSGDVTDSPWLGIPIIRLSPSAI